jgi:hypothetical protein
MRIMPVVLLSSVLLAAPDSRADFVDGSVFLFPIGSATEFRSYGRAEYLNTLNQRIVAPIAGEHSVSGPQVFTTTFSEPDGLYDDFLEGPTEPGACYSTRLQAWAVGDFGIHRHEASWDGPDTRCASSSPPSGDPPPLETCDHCGEGGMQNEPLILDMNGDGVWTTAKTVSPVWFDLNGNGIADLVAWTHPDHEDAFLYVDWNGNRQIDGGRELFGDATILPNGTKASHGYEALAAYDEKRNGGDADGAITRRDRIWSRLRLWVDRNHDGLMARDENDTLGQAGVVSISLEAEVFGPDRNFGADENGNLHFLRGSFQLRERGRVTQRALHEVWFAGEIR